MATKSLMNRIDSHARAACGIWSVRDIETITNEIVSLKLTAGNAILGIGQCLIEAKELLPHGEWLSWLREKVQFSERSAQNYMRLAQEWSNPQPVADLGVKKAVMLLALPEAEREQFLAEPHRVGKGEKTVVEMTSRELEHAIKAHKTEQTAVMAMPCTTICEETEVVVDVEPEKPLPVEPVSYLRADRTLRIGIRRWLQFRIRN